MKDKSQTWIYIIFILVVLVGIFAFSGEYLETKKENKLLKQVIFDREGQLAITISSINQLRTELKECRNENKR